MACLIQQEKEEAPPQKECSILNWVFYPPKNNHQMVFIQQIGLQYYHVKTQITKKLVCVPSDEIEMTNHGQHGCGDESIYEILREFQPNFLQQDPEEPVLTMIPDDWHKELYDPTKKYTDFLFL